MADEDRPDAPQLEAPSLGKLFGRRKGSKSSGTPGTPEPAEEPTAPADWAPVEAPVAADPAQVADEPHDSAPVDPAPVDPAPVASAPVDPAPVDPAPVEETSELPPAREPAPVPSPAAVPAPVADLRPLNEARARRAAATQSDLQGPPADRAPRATLSVNGWVASALTGLVVGLLVVVLTAGSLALCESVRGVASCGGGPGLALLVAVTVAMIVLGGVMLRLARVPDPTSTSFLGVGLLCVLSLLFLVDVLDQWWMVIVVPAISTATFLLSHWVTTAVIEAD